MRTCLFARGGTLGPLAIIVVFLGLSIWLHTTDGSTLIQSDQVWANRVDFHHEFAPFAGRYFTDSGISLLTSIGLSPAMAFAVIQYALLVALGLVFFRFLRVCGFGFRESLLGLSLLLSAYPILFAFIAPVYTWDDVWQYLFTTLAFMWILQKRSGLAAIAFTLSCLAREGSLLLWPVYALAVWSTNTRQWHRAALYIGAPVLIGVAYTLALSGAPDPARFQHFHRNFENLDRATASVFSFLISYGWLWVTTALGLIVFNVAGLATKVSRMIFIGTAIYLPVTVVSALTMGLAWETRLFFPAFIFVVPLTLMLLQQYREAFLVWRRGWRLLPAIGVVVASLAGGQLLARSMFPEVWFRGAWPVTQLYFGLQIGIAFIVLVGLTVWWLPRLRT